MEEEEEEEAVSFEKVLEAGVWEWLWRRRQQRDSEGDATAHNGWPLFNNVAVTGSLGKESTATRPDDEGNCSSVTDNRPDTVGPGRQCGNLSSFVGV